MLKSLLYLILILLGFPVGIFLFQICKKEAKAWKKRLSIMSIIAFILIIIIFLLDFSYKIPTIVALLFMITTLVTIIWKVH